MRFQRAERSSGGVQSCIVHGHVEWSCYGHVECGFGLLIFQPAVTIQLWLARVLDVRAAAAAACPQASANVFLLNQDIKINYMV